MSTRPGNWPISAQTPCKKWQNPPRIQHGHWKIHRSLGVFPLQRRFLNEDVTKCHVCFSQDFSGTFRNAQIPRIEKNGTRPVEAPSLSRFRQDDRFHGQRGGGSLGSFRLGVFFSPSASRNDAGKKMMRLGAKICSAGGSLKNCFQGTTWKAKAESDDYSHQWSPGFDFPSWGGLTTTAGTL